MIKYTATSLKELNRKKLEQKQREAAALNALAAVAALEDALCEIDEMNAERFAAIENALCDIDAGV